MPDINLLKDTKQPEDQRPKPPSTAQGPLTDPQVETKGLGGVFQSLLGRKPKIESVATPSAMSLRGKSGGERVISDKTKGAPTMVPLPDDESTNVNLLGEDIISKINPSQRLIQLGLAAVGAVALVALLSFGLSYYRRTIDTDVQSTKQKTTEVQQKISELEQQAQEISVVTGRLQAIRNLVDNHVRWTRFFERLEHYTIKEVAYGSSFSGTMQPTVVLSARTDSYESLAKQYLIFEQAAALGDFISDFSITGATRSIEDKVEIVQFSVTLTLVPSIFLNPPVDQSKIPTLTSDNRAVICYLSAHAEGISLFPLSLRSSMQPTVAQIQAADCANLPVDNLARGQTLLQTDEDRDGLSSYLETALNTSDQKEDTDGDGLTDLQEILSCSNPNGTGVLEKCSPAST